MLGTFPFEPYFKSYCLFTFRSLKVLKFRLGPCLLPQLPSLLSLTADSATPPAAALGHPRPTPTSPLLRAGVHASRPSSSTPSSFALELPPFATPRRTVSRPPPRRRRGPSPLQHPRPLSRARASAPEKTLHSVSLALSLFPCPDTPERRRRSTERRRASSPPSSRASTAAPPKSTTPIALPRPRAALRPNSALRPPPEPPRRRSRAPPPPCSL